MDPHWKKNRDGRLQELGSQLVNHMHTYLRALQLYRPDNDIFRRPLEHIHDIINEVVKQEGELSLFGDESTLMLNEVLLRFPFAMLPSVHYLLKLWAERDAGGFCIESSVNAEQLREFMAQFAPQHQAEHGHHAPQLQGVIRTESLKRVRMRLSKSPQDELQQLTSMKVDAKQYAILLYSRLLQLVQRYLKGEGSEDTPNMNQIIRTLQELIDLCGTNKMRFLGFTNEMDPRAYEAYHICNTIYFSLLFAWHLGLDRIQMLDLGRAGIQHTRGKRYLSTELLDKSVPLSPEEKRELRMISIYSVLDALKGEFSWDKLRQAIVIAGIYEPGQPLRHTPYAQRHMAPPSDEREPSPYEGPWLYSHILRLSSTYDALCTRRPYRVKLYPSEALKLMQERLRHQFDPYLLGRFVHFFGNMAIDHRNQTQQIQIPHDPRLQHSLGEVSSPFGQQKHIQDELQQYWQLRTQRNRSDKEEKHLQAMRNTIMKRMGTMVQPKG